MKITGSAVNFTRDNREKYLSRIKNYNSFFLSVSLPRNRWQANCVFRSVETRKCNETLRLWPGSAEPCGAIGACLRIQVRAS